MLQELQNSLALASASSRIPKIWVPELLSPSQSLPGLIQQSESGAGAGAGAVVIPNTLPRVTLTPQHSDPARGSQLSVAHRQIPVSPKNLFAKDLANALLFPPFPLNPSSDIQGPCSSRPEGQTAVFSRLCWVLPTARAWRKSTEQQRRTGLGSPGRAAQQGNRNL